MNSSGHHEMNQRNNSEHMPAGGPEMEVAQHTPGPWKMELVRDDTASPGSKPQPDRWEIKGPSGEQVVKVSFDRDYFYPEGGIENEADARLIASVPDLLAECNRLRAAIQDAEKEKAPRLP